MYICAAEAIWRILENPMHDRSHAIYRLAVHLPEEQMVYFRSGNAPQAAVRASHRQTNLSAWFQLNQTDIEARNFIYSEIPYHYVFNKQSCVWNTRKRGENKVISRLNTVSQRDEERFHLRLLLLHVQGAQSFEDL